MITVTVNEAKDSLVWALKSGLVPMLHGSPAIGKSAVIRDIAKMFNLLLIDVRLSQMEPTDLSGLPFFKDGKASYNAFDTFPLEGDEVPKGYKGWLIFFDEMNSALVQTQAAAYKVILDRMVGNHKLHPMVAMACAGNLETDGAIVNPMSTAMQSRLVHLQLMPDAKEFTAWAEANGFDTRIVDYLYMRPDAVYNFKPGHTDKTYGSPRTWEFLNRLLQNHTGPLTKKQLPMLAGTVGEGIAREFYAHCQIQPPKFSQIMENPRGFPMPDNKSVQFALTGACASNFSEETAEPILDFVDRLDPELQILTVRRIVRKSIKYLALPRMAKWKEKLAAEMM